MTEFFTYFSNREIALFTWVFMVVIAMLFSKSIRKLIGGLKAFFVKSILIMFLLFIGFVGLIVFVLFEFGFWDISLLKDTILWTFGFAIVLVFRTNQRKRISDFKAIVKDAIKWTIILEFFVAFYTFSLTIELIILPILVFIGMIQAYPGTDQKYSQVSEILKTTLNLIGLIIFGFVMYKTFYQGGETITTDISVCMDSRYDKVMNKALN